jgi:hypothetical protein
MAGRGGQSTPEWRPSPMAMGNVRLINANRPRQAGQNRLKTETMRHRVLCAVFAAIWLLAAASVPLSAPALAQSTDVKPTEQAPATGQEPAKDNQKIDEFAEAQKAIAGPAGNPECVWLGRRVVSLLWRDDLDTAFRHLDLYDRFGCPSGHIQASFRCLLLHAGSIDPKVPDSLNARVQSCWLNPTQQAAATPAPAPAPAAAAPSPTTNR